ncbi:hypothetical protein [Litorihabitans aurantiacus]|uniref:Uncharacterized protein n=1 Tax=Litorihabitans aurantiacus TaxID=1930061 RepID=A0AA37XGZ2_9MICO|nr:hypothetical protein [Litorihabitans aurantiacus]GMA32841.1 hypothetical protein GCM10025875_28330 [Litorihabitans aurantiacus]
MKIEDVYHDGAALLPPDPIDIWRTKDALEGALVVSCRYDPVWENASILLDLRNAEWPLKGQVAVLEARGLEHFHYESVPRRGRHWRAMESWTTSRPSDVWEVHAFVLGGASLRLRANFFSISQGSVSRLELAPPILGSAPNEKYVLSCHPGMMKSR